MDIGTLYHRTVDGWAARVSAVGAEQWEATTPCEDWDVRTLVNHVVGEDLWTEPLVRGETIEEVGDRFDGDLLGDQPAEAALTAAAEATAAVAETLPTQGTVQLSFGETPMNEYVYQLAADHLIHGWDLAAATGGDTQLDPELVAEVAGWFTEREEMYRSAGAVAERPESGGDPQSDLLAGFGRSADWSD